MENLSSPSIASSEDGGLGNLSSLPREIRDLIWREFLPKVSTESPETQCNSSSHGQLALLRTSRSIYCEVGSQIYPSGRNPFIIYVTPEYKYQSWITISNGKLRPAVWHLRSLEDAMARGFLRMAPHPAAFRIEIEAPDKNDAGQAICLFRKVKDVVEMLGQSTKRPRAVEVELKDGMKSKWFDIGKPTTTALDGKPCPPNYQCMLLPFLQLRHIKRSEVKVPEGVTLDHDDFATMRNIERMMNQATPFGEFHGSTEWSDKKTQSNIDKHDSRCGRAMALLPGRTAMMLRFECFFGMYSNELSVAKDLEKKMECLLMEGQSQGEQRDSSRTIQDNATIRRLKEKHASMARRAVSRDFLSQFFRMMRQLEFLEESLQSESGHPS